MAERRQLNHPPIREAAINIQISPELPPAFAETLYKSWPGGKRRPLNLGRFQLQVGEQFTGSGSQELIGVRVDSEDGRLVVQARRNGITFSILKDYKDWDELEARTLEMWRKFLDFAGASVTVSGVTSRFINVLRVPLNADFDEYLTAAPRVPAGLPQSMGQFFQRIAVPLNPQMTAIIVQALDVPMTDAVSVILDIDVQLACSARTNEVPELIRSLREPKDDVFFSSVTERALEGC